MTHELNAVLVQQNRDAEEFEIAVKEKKSLRPQLLREADLYKEAYSINLSMMEVLEKMCTCFRKEENDLAASQQTLEEKRAQLIVEEAEQHKLREEGAEKIKGQERRMLALRALKAQIDRHLRKTLEVKSKQQGQLLEAKRRKSSATKTLADEKEKVSACVKTIAIQFESVNISTSTAHAITYRVTAETDVSIDHQINHRS
mmetsp:Transcript_12726/g.20687  ORF Transcript_12726/g.20687 Transcript_12726/m.20687 type:complete len:201 (+) Transcript_12726:1747-2349(+)